MATTAIVVFSGESSASRAREGLELLGRRRREPELGDLVGQPRQPGHRIRDVARRVHGDDRTHGDPDVVEPDRCGAKATLEYARACPDAGSDGADRHIGSSRLRCGEPELGGRAALPPADGQIEDHRRRDDGHQSAIHHHAPVVLLQPVHHAVGGGQAERAASREHDGVDVAHAVGGVQQIGLAAARRSAADVDRAGRAAWRQHDGGSARPSGAQSRIRVESLVVPDEDSGHVGDRAAHALPLRFRRAFPRSLRDCAPKSLIGAFIAPSC